MIILRKCCTRSNSHNIDWNYEKLRRKCILWTNILHCNEEIMHLMRKGNIAFL